MGEDPSHDTFSLVAILRDGGRTSTARLRRLVHRPPGPLTYKVTDETSKGGPKVGD